MSPREKSSARAKCKLESSEKIANGTAGQTTPLLRATPLASVGFKQLLVRTAGRETVRRNRGRTRRTRRSRKAAAKSSGPEREKGRIAQCHPGCKRCKQRFRIRDFY